MDIVNQLKQIWWVVTFLISIVAYLVSIHFKVNASYNATKKLFARVEILEKWVAKSDTKFDSLIKAVDHNHDRMNEQFKGLNERFDKIIDRLIERQK